MTDYDPEEHLAELIIKVDTQASIIKIQETIITALLGQMIADRKRHISSLIITSIIAGVVAVTVYNLIT